jgi:hypothetical protein
MTIVDLVKLLIVIISCPKMIGNLYFPFKIIKHVEPDLKYTNQHLNLKDSAVIDVHMAHHDLISNIVIV